MIWIHDYKQVVVIHLHEMCETHTRIYKGENLCLALNVYKKHTMWIFNQIIRFTVKCDSQIKL